MLPSPSLGPPLLSLSLSPAFGPCGIPLELDVDVFAGVDVAWVAPVLEGLELPQPAIARQARTSTQMAYRRAGREVVLLILWLSILSFSCSSTGEPES